MLQLLTHTQDYMQKYKIELMPQFLLCLYNQHIFSNDDDPVTEIGQGLFQGII